MKYPIIIVPPIIISRENKRSFVEMWLLDESTTIVFDAMAFVNNEQFPCMIHQMFSVIHRDLIRRDDNWIRAADAPDIYWSAATNTAKQGNAVLARSVV